MGAGLPQLVAGDDEVLAQHRDVDRGAHGVQVGERPAEPALLGEHADDGGAAGLVVGGERGRVVDGRELALGRAAALDLGDDAHAVVAAQRGDAVLAGGSLGRGLLELVEREQRLALGQVGTHTLEDVVEHAHPQVCPSGPRCCLPELLPRPTCPMRVPAVSGRCAQCIRTRQAISCRSPDAGRRPARPAGPDPRPAAVPRSARRPRARARPPRRRPAAGPARAPAPARSRCRPAGRRGSGRTARCARTPRRGRRRSGPDRRRAPRSTPTAGRPGQARRPAPRDGPPASPAARSRPGRRRSAGPGSGRCAPPAASPSSATRSSTPSRAQRSRHTSPASSTSCGQVDVREVDPEVLRAQPGQVEQVADQPVQPLAPRPASTAPVRATSSRRDDPVGERLGVAAHGGQRGAQLVRHRQQELPLAPLAGGQGGVQAVEGVGQLGHLVRALRLQPDVARPAGQPVRRRRRVLDRPRQPAGQQEARPGRRRPGRAAAGRPAGGASTSTRPRRPTSAGPGRRRDRRRPAGPRPAPRCRSPGPGPRTGPAPAAALSTSAGSGMPAPAARPRPGRRRPAGGAAGRSRATSRVVPRSSAVATRSACRASVVARLLLGGAADEPERHQPGDRARR